jgi:hypothetical protein
MEDTHDGTVPQATRSGLPYPVGGAFLDRDYRTYRNRSHSTVHKVDVVVVDDHIDRR